MLHVLEDHDERVTIATDTIELDDVLVLQVGEQLCLPLEVLPGSQCGVLQGLGGQEQWPSLLEWYTQPFFPSGDARVTRPVPSDRCLQEGTASTGQWPQSSQLPGNPKRLPEGMVHAEPTPVPKF